MKYSNEKLELIKKALNEKNVGKICLECGCDDLITNELEFQLVSINRNKEKPTIENLLTYKFVAAVICPNCGSTKLFDLKTLIGQEEALKL